MHLLHPVRPRPMCVRPRVVPAFLLAGLCSVLAGCIAVHKQVQYFAATDPETGATNYYRMTVTGGGGGLVDYHVQAGYFSAAAVDILRGSMPDVPELDLPVERLEVFDWLNTHFFAALIQEAKRLHFVFDPEALRTSAHSAVAYAEQRLGTIDADVSKFSAELTAAQTKQTAKEQSQTAAHAEVETQRAMLVQATNDVAAAAATLETTRGEEANLKVNSDRKQSEVESLRIEIATLEAEATALETRASAEGATETDKQAATNKRAVATKAREDLTTLLTTAGAALDDLALKRNGLAGAERLADAKTKAATAVSTALHAAEAKERNAILEAEAAQRAVRRLQDKVARLNVEKARQQAARDYANETLTKLEEAGDAPVPFSPLAEGQEAAPLDEAKIVELARLIWYGSLSSSDLASIGMTQNTSPYQFRKLVFWATAANIDLNEMAGEIDGILDNVTAVASAFRTQAKAKKAQESGRRNAMNKVLDNIPLGPQGEIIRGLLEMQSPATAESGAPAGLESLIGGLPK